jgi:hypothetical protein
MRRFVGHVGAVLLMTAGSPFAGALADGLGGLASSLTSSMFSAEAQSVAEVIDGMYAAVERQAAGVQDYTLSQQVMGFDTYSYFEKEMVDGRPIFKLQMSDGAGFSFGLGGEDVGLGDGPKFLEHGIYTGTEQIGNFTVHVLTVEGDAAADIVPPRGPDQVEYRPRAVRLYVDAQMMVPRRIVLEGDAITDTGPQALGIQIDLQNFLPIESLLVPFKTTLQIAGMSVDVTITEVLINAGRPTA